MYWVKTPVLLRRLCSGYWWQMPTASRELFLTFDDGPTPFLTEEVLQTLQAFQAQATFFLVGNNAERYPDLVKKIREGHHSIGNHTYHHLNGWTTPASAYLSDIHRCSELVPAVLFRPPYGLITRRQAREASRRYQIVMWDVLSGDFDHHLPREKCLHNVMDYAAPGSIIVFHDSIKAADRMLYALPRVLDYFASRRYRFSALPMPASRPSIFAGA
ncbi:MAG: polysaccharide deacetylase family protein [Chitinophagales bacterium]|nr:polysaccharide deacetylase family protein [Chitinophagales bacterium]MDW8393804.1 polysaccharide deacetylase family protein [Chitinophagales bacterium]